MKKIAIIGGGIAGLSCAWVLRKRGIDFKLIEKNDKVGGRIADYPINGTIISLGAEVFSKHYLTLMSIMREMQLSSDIQPAYRRRGVFVDGRLINLKFASILLDRHFPIDAKIDLARLRRFLMSFSPNSITEDLFETNLEEYILHNYTEQVLKYIAEPLCQGYFSRPAKTVSAANGLRAMSTAMIPFHLKGELYRLVEALESRMSDNIMKGVEVENVDVHDQNEFSVHYGTKSERFNIVICCMPAPASKKLLPDASIPDVPYSTKNIYVIQGKPRFPQVAWIINGDNRYPLGLIFYKGAFGKLSTEQSDPDLSAFFESGKIVHQYRFEYSAPRGGLQKESLRSREYTTNIPNLYVGGDYVYGGGLEAGARAGAEIGEQVLKDLAGTS